MTYFIMLIYSIIKTVPNCYHFINTVLHNENIMGQSFHDQTSKILHENAMLAGHSYLVELKRTVVKVIIFLSLIVCR